MLLFVVVAVVEAGPNESKSITLLLVFYYCY